jgi:hypothetical protein
MPASERFCHGTFTSPLTTRARSLPAGTYWLVVENSDNPDVTVTAAITTPPTPTVTYAMSTPTGVTFFDACSAAGHGTVPFSSPDDSTATFPASASPFPLRMFGLAAAADVPVCTNGWLSLMATTTTSLSSDSLPSDVPPNLVIAPYWDDLYQRAAGGSMGAGSVCYAATGTAPNRRFVVQWNNFHFCCSDDPAVHLTFEVVFNEAATATANNVIDVVYNRMDGASDPSTAGIENDTGDVGYTISPPFTAPRVVRFTPSM